MLSNPPSSSGFSTSWLNAGDLQNKGVELSLNARPVTTRNITWNTTLNFWLNRSLVTRLIIPPTPQGSFGYVLGSYQIQQGASATQILGLSPTGIVKWGDAEPIFQMNTYNEITFQNKFSLRFLLHWKNGGQNVNLTNLENDFGRNECGLGYSRPFKKEFPMVLTASARLERVHRNLYRIQDM